MTDVSERNGGSRLTPAERRDLILGAASLVIAVLSAGFLKTVFDADPTLTADRSIRPVAMLPAIPFVVALMSWFRFSGRQDELFRAKDGIALRIAVLFSAGFATSTTLLQEVAGRDPLPMLLTVMIFIVGYGVGWVCAWEKYR